MTPSFGTMRLRLAAILQARGMTAYGLHKASRGRLSLSTTHRLARDEWTCLSRTILATLCDVLSIEPGELFERRPQRSAKHRG